MNKINLLLAGANGNLSGKEEIIKNAAKMAEKYIFTSLNIDWDIDVLFEKYQYDMILFDEKIGIRARAKDFVEISLRGDDVTENLLAEMIVRGLCCAARMGKTDQNDLTLLGVLVDEGIATYCEAQFAQNLDEKTDFIKTILNRTDEEHEAILKSLHDQLDHENYDFGKIFIANDQNGFHWQGYSAGYYLVKKYLDKTGKSAKDVLSVNSESFRGIL